MQKKEGRKYHSTSLTAQPIAKQVLFTVWGNGSKVQSTRHVMHKSVNNVLCKPEAVPTPWEVQCILSSLHCHILNHRYLCMTSNSSVHMCWWHSYVSFWKNLIISSILMCGHQPIAGMPIFWCCALFYSLASKVMNSLLLMFDVTLPNNSLASGGTADPQFDVHCACTNTQFQHIPSVSASATQHPKSHMKEMEEKYLWVQLAYLVFC